MTQGTKRWNGWGNSQTDYPLPDVGLDFLQTKLGSLPSVDDCTLEEIVPNIPTSRLPDHPLVDTTPETRLRHARGQSLPDWIALRSGRIPVFPDGVAFPVTDDAVRSLVQIGINNGIKLIPYGGGTSVV